MKTRNKYFIYLISVLGALFVFGAASVIYCVFNAGLVPSAKSTEHTMAFVYLIVHLIVVAFAAYLASKAYFFKSMIVSVVMTLENGERNPKAYRNAIIVGSVFALAGIFFFLNAFQIIHVMSFFSLGLNMALTNVFLSVSAVSFTLYFYKPVIASKVAN